MMFSIRVRKFFANIVAGFCWSYRLRLRVRVNVAAPLWGCMRFVRRIHGRDAKIEKFYGAGGKSLVLGVDGKYVYKFSCAHDMNEIARKERDVVNYFKAVSPIPTPSVTLLKKGRELVRRYDYIHGVPLSAIRPKVLIENAETLGRQLAEFLYAVGCQDPACLKKYKKHTVDLVRPFFGWNHDDWDNLENFFVDTKSMQIIAVIDWENARFRDYYYRLYRDTKPEKRALFDVVEREYKKLYQQNILNNLG